AVQRGAARPSVGRAYCCFGPRSERSVVSAAVHSRMAPRGGFLLPPSIGMRFSRFELVSRLASGGMGDVWRARDQELHRDVAVKFLPERFAADPARLGRFAQEARAASQLNHPNIVTIHEIGETSGLPYI